MKQPKVYEVEEDQYSVSSKKQKSDKDWRINPLNKKNDTFDKVKKSIENLVKESNASLTSTKENINA